MAELTPRAFDSPLPADVQRPCPDCNGPALWLDTPRGDNSHLEMRHQWGCPGTWGRRLEASGRRPGAIVCDDCGGPAVWVDTPAPNGKHKVQVHEDGCPGFAARPNPDRSDSREGNTP